MPDTPVAPPLGQRRRPPPAAETGRSCWGRGQQDARPAPRAEADAGSRNPGAKHLWRVGQVHAGRAKHDMAQKGGPCYRGQQLLDNAPCQAVAGLDSGALPFPRYCASLVQTKADRHANGSPSGRAGERSETERASPGQKSFCAAISRFFVRAILSLCFYISVSILALSVIAKQ